MKKRLTENLDSKGGFAGDAEDKAEMYRRGMTRDEAREKLLGLLNGDGVAMLTNDDSGETARLGKKPIEKMVSGAAVNKSEGNNFTARQHYAVVSDIGSLFKDAIKILERPDRNGDPSVFIHRFAAPIGFNNAAAYITVKENRLQGGKKLHTVELIEIGKLEGTLTGVGQKTITHSPAPSSPTDNIAKLKAAIKKKDKNLFDPAVGGSSDNP